MKKILAFSVLTGALLLSVGSVSAADKESAKAAVPPAQADARPLMTKQERAEHRAKMRAAKTPGEREKIRKAHHEKMKERAKERGVTLPDEPPVRGSGMGPGAGGMGTGGGMGPGSGMGPGNGMGPGGGR